MQLTCLRFLSGAPVAILLATWQLGPSGLAISRGEVVPLVILALGLGLLAMSLYYRGLSATPASLATFGELAFPLTAVTLGAAVVGQPLSATQWSGAVLLVGAITLLALSSGRERRLVTVPEPRTDRLLPSASR